ncbi:alpha-tubulin N-acetyltransferase 1-like isoform X2 [Pieris napi]|uniref:alpha-tubulin N-acetyltransferase 1-like isoform X2 n=1 Tax=Pieris napi TaxID=78633 RepID=UPI001FBA8B1D|nr:alpha-tubulin N-acetyltransferase 1-like isoform X2 [Pieris napi]
MMMKFTINTVLKQEISKIDHVFLPADFQGNVSQIRLVQEYLKNVVNWIGEKSTKAQGLSKTLTSMDKLRSSEHILYLLKDAEGNNGAGQVIGILKIGVKSLYLHDESLICHKVSPLCILDFYVLEEYQKMGFGKKLFDYMLADQCTTVDRIAIDNPSQKFENFLQKHYNIGKLLRQHNCFAVSAKFFENVQSINNSTSGRSTPTLPTVGSVGRYAAQQPPSSMNWVIHGGDNRRYNTEIPARPKTTSESKADQSLVIDELKLINEPERIINVPEAKYLERPSSLEVRPVSEQITIDVTSHGSISSHPTPSLTKDGYVDLKYYHNKLW